MPNVLIVDDEPDYRELLRAMLSREGYAVETARDANEALAIQKFFEPQVVIVDWMLRNKLHGLDVIALLRNAGVDFESIIITGYPSDSLTAQIAESNVFAFLEKPFNATELRTVVRDALISRQVESTDILPEVSNKRNGRDHR